MMCQLAALSRAPRGGCFARVGQESVFSWITRSKGTDYTEVHCQVRWLLGKFLLTPQR